MKKGEIYYVDFGYAQGSEQGGKRPAVIVQNDIGNKYSPTTIVVPLTTQNKTKLPTHTAIRATKSSLALAEQIRVVDKSRILRYVGKITNEEMERLERALAVSLGLPTA